MSKSGRLPTGNGPSAETFPNASYTDESACPSSTRFRDFINSAFFRISERPCRASDRFFRARKSAILAAVLRCSAESPSSRTVPMPTLCRKPAESANDTVDGIIPPLCASRNALNSSIHVFAGKIVPAAEACARLAKSSLQPTATDATYLSPTFRPSKSSTMQPSRSDCDNVSTNVRADLDAASRCTSVIPAIDCPRIFNS